MFWDTAAHAASAEEVADALARCGSGLVESLPALGPDAHQQLADGQIVRQVHRNANPDAPSSAVGMRVLPASLPALWIAVQDPHAQVDPALTEFITEQKGPDHAIWYGYLDLPRPIHDRQWLVESTNNHALAKASGNRCWEHNWRLVDDGLPQIAPLFEQGAMRGLTSEQLAAAVYTPVNHGHWLLAALPSGTETLVVYQATSVIGGNIPDWLVLRLSLSRLDEVLQSAGVRATVWAPGHYGPGHAPVPGADGADLVVLRQPQ